MVVVYRVKILVAGRWLVNSEHTKYEEAESTRDFLQEQGHQARITWMYVF